MAAHFVVPARVPARALVLLASLMLGACSWFDSRDDWRSKTLGDLPSTTGVIPSAPLPKIASLNEIEQGYKQALALADSPALRQQILLRMADLDMLRSEQAQLDATEAGQFFAAPIAQYRALIAFQEQQPTPGIPLDQLRYKLAKALSLDGHIDAAAAELNRLAEAHQGSSLLAETQFRRGEQAFGDGDYAIAEAAYAAAEGEAQNPLLQQNALYMKGWAQFKRGDYARALVSFSQVLDQMLGQSGSHETVAPRLEALGAAKTNLVNDTLRVAALSLSYLEGADALQALLAERGERPYTHLLYQQLGQLYQQQERYLDSAASYQHFVQRYPNSALAPAFSILAIEAFEQGNFPSELLPAKQDFVQRYGINSAYWAERQGDIGAQASTYLHQSLAELASYEHAQAQALAATPASRAQAPAAYGRAASWYKAFIDSFPSDPALAEKTYLMAESLGEAGDLPAATIAFEQVAYGLRDGARGADAGYAALLLPAQVLAQPLAEQDLLLWQERKIDNALRFAETFPADARALPALAATSDDLLRQQRYDQARQVAERVLAAQPAAAPALQFSSWLVLGHSLFELQDYAAAEQAYSQVLALQPSLHQLAGAPSALQVRERLAASIYRQAEASLAAGDKPQAIIELLRIAPVASDTEIAAKAQYDAGVYLMEEERWAEAEAVYVGYRQQYAQHSLAASLPAKMVQIYQQQEKWSQAADELLLMERGSSDPEVKRQALYLGAELYEKSGRREQAIAQYRRYAQEYAQPLAQQLEAQQRLAELYAASGDQTQRRFWLQRLIDGHQRAGSGQTERSAYLAASAQTELSQAALAEFAQLKITLPINNSLPRKRAAMENALRSQEQILSYGISEFTTRASFHIAEVYAQLSRDLMASQRPRELDELALEQYEILLEEQAYPFEEKAIEIHQANAQRSWTGIYDPWVKRSFSELAKLLPARYNKSETRVEVSRDIH